MAFTCWPEKSAVFAWSTWALSRRWVLKWSGRGNVTSRFLSRKRGSGSGGYGKENLETKARGNLVMGRNNKMGWNVKIEIWWWRNPDDK